MPKLSPALKRYLHWLFWALAIIVLDQVSKQLVSGWLNYGEQVPILPSLNLTLAYNPGAAFSFLADAGGWQRHFFTALAIGVSGFILWVLWKKPQGTWMNLALMLIMAGAIGNVIDRILFGHVIDFIQVFYKTWYFPAFNVADSAITIGSVIMLADGLFNKENQA